MEIERAELIKRGKTNNVFLTNIEEILEFESSDRIYSDNPYISREISGKGEINNEISMYCFMLLEKKGINTHFINIGTNDSSKFVRKLDMIELEVICRRYSAGSFCKRFGVEEGLKIEPSGIEFSLKNDSLRDPFIPEFAVLSMNIVTEEELAYIKETTSKVSDILSEYFDNLGIILVDFKIEFGRDEDGNLVIGDEISPDTCRLVDKQTGKKLDKDLIFESEEEIKMAYMKVLERVQTT